jgi:hypothetical protein
MSSDKFKQKLIAEMDPDEFLAKRNEVLRIFRAEESVRVSSALPFLVAWGSVGQVLNADLGEYTVWLWLGIAMVALYLTQLSSNIFWRIWVCVWSSIAIGVMCVNHEWFKLSIAGLGLSIGCSLIAISQEKRAEALGLAGKYDLLNANGDGSKNDVLPVRDVIEIYKDILEMKAISGASWIHINRAKDVTDWTESPRK